MPNKSSIINNEDGSIIFVAVMILALLTLLGISSSTTSITEVKIATNTQRYQMDFYVADSGWKEAVIWLNGLGGKPLDVNTTQDSDGIDNDADGVIDEASETGNVSVLKNFGSNGFDSDQYNTDFPAGTEDGTSLQYNIPFWYRVTHLGAQIDTSPGTGANVYAHSFQITSNANGTQQIDVTAGKSWPGGYNN
jgi:Tfp pilus assembly protein PilX